MKKFEYVYELADELYRKSIQINLLLKEALNDKKDNSMQIGSLYAHRKEILDNIGNFTKSDEGSAFFEKENANWDKVSRKIADIEIKNVTLMDEVMKNTRMGLNKLNSKKKLFVYTKGAKNGNKFDIRS
jgi:ribosomal protein L24